MSYTPQPIDISHIILTAEQLKLAEQIARNVHAVWSQDQLNEGWIYGKNYDPTAHTHPNLAPYGQLSARSQQHQQAAIHTVLKVALALGFRIDELASSTSQPTAIAESPDITFILETLKESSELNLTTLLTLQQETIKLRPRTPEIYRALGESILQLGEPLMAYDVLAEGLKHWSGDLRLQQLLALALARSGSTVAANTLLTQLVDNGHQDEETIGLLARTHKDLWTQANTPALAEKHLRLATQRYCQAYNLTGSTWAGINAATMACLMNQVDQAELLAEDIQEKCLAQLHSSVHPTTDPYWLLATLGEAALILGEWAAAEDFYGKAVASGQGRFGDFNSSRRNALLLGKHLEIDLHRIKEWFHIPKVVVFCGHMIDRPDRPSPRFPPELEPKVYEAICDRLRRLDARLGYASAACGADILFLEALQSLKGELHIVLPYDREEFIKDSVSIRPDGKWEKRFEQVMNNATEVIVTSKRKLPYSPVVYEYSNRFLHGLAKIRAEQLGTDLVPLTVWNGEPGDGMGGTASTVNHWKQWNETVEVIDLTELLQTPPIKLPPAQPIVLPAIASDQLNQTDPSDQNLRALLFADVVNYTRLSEDQFFPFADHFLGTVAQILDSPGYQPLMKNTWGDAIYLVFATVQQAGEVALDLCDLMQTVDWTSKGLPDDLSLRIALHAGPVSRKINPLTGQMNYVGTHVNHAARIEPITPPGKVYASQVFAAIASSEGSTTFCCDYVGQMPWAKHYGTFPTYHVRRASGLTTSMGPLRLIGKAQTKESEGVQR